MALNINKYEWMKHNKSKYTVSSKEDDGNRFLMNQPGVVSRWQ